MKKLIKGSKGKQKTNPSKQSGINRTKISKKSIIDSIDKSFEIGDALRDKMKSRIASRISTISDSEKKAKKAFKKFLPSRVSSNLREGKTYLNQKDDFKIV